MTVDRCGNCGLTDATNLKECAGCERVHYCSRDCQKAQWKAHKKWCKLSAKIFPRKDTLKLHPKDIEDFNAALDYAKENVPHLKHVKINIPQEYMLGQYLLSEFSQAEPEVKLSPNQLFAFLQSFDELQSFELHFDDCCWQQVRKMTDGGKALRPLAGHRELQVLSTTCMVFNDVSDLESILNERKETLKVLGLRSLTLGYIEVGPWPQEGSQRLVDAISPLTKLVTLRISYCPLVDSDLERLLPEKSDIRVLVLTGAFGDVDRGRFGQITDAGAATIAHLCPNLQSLELSYQHQITTSGVESILRGCQHLRQLSVEGAKIRSQDLIRLLPLSTKLLLFRWSQGRLPAPPGAGMEDMREAIIATGGRTLILVEFHGLVEVPGLPAACVLEATRSKQLVEEADDRGKDATIHNKWELLM